MNATLNPDANVTLHAMVPRHCCCSDVYNSCNAKLSLKQLYAIVSDDNCTGWDDNWSTWFDIPIQNVTEDEVVFSIIITPNSNSTVRGYQSNNITIRLQGMLACLLSMYMLEFQ